MSYRKSELTARELEILKLIALGKSNEQIGEALNISGMTVKSRVTRMLGFCNVRNRAALVTYGFSRYLLDADELRGRWEEQRVSGDPIGVR